MIRLYLKEIKKHTRRSLILLIDSRQDRMLVQEIGEEHLNEHSLVHRERSQLHKPLHPVHRHLPFHKERTTELSCKKALNPKSRKGNGLSKPSTFSVYLGESANRLSAFYSCRSDGLPMYSYLIRLLREPRILRLSDSSGLLGVELALT